MTPKEIGPFRCPRCGAPTWGNLKHCLECGQALDKACDSCGVTWRYFYDYAFCPECGNRVKSKRTGTHNTIKGD